MNDAEMLRFEQEHEEQDVQLASLDKLYQQRIETHAFLRTQMFLEEICNRSNKNALLILTGLEVDVNERTFVADYRYKGLKIKEQSSQDPRTQSA